MQSSIYSRIDPPRVSQAGWSDILELRSLRETDVASMPPLVVGLLQTPSKLLTGFISYRIYQTPWSMTSSVCRSRPAAPALYQLLHKARDQSGLR
jgi:hypothetical protein